MMNIRILNSQQVNMVLAFIKQNARNDQNLPWKIRALIELLTEDDVIITQITPGELFLPEHTVAEQFTRYEQ